MLPSMHVDQSVDHETQIFGACAILGSVDWLYLFWYLLRGLPLRPAPHSPLQGTDDGLRFCSCRISRLQISSTLYPGTGQDLVWRTSHAYFCARLDSLFSLVRLHASAPQQTDSDPSTAFFVLFLAIF